MDYALFCACALILFASLQAWAWRGYRNDQLLGGSVLACICLLIGGWLLVNGAGNRAQVYVEEMLEGYAATYAAEIETMGHADLTVDTPEDDPTYLRIIEAQKRWLAENPRIADIYTFRKLQDGRIILLVDSETDYDRNGRIEGVRERRTPIGETYREITDALISAFAGKAGFDNVVVTDRWGTWVSAYKPIRDAEGRLDAVVAIDFEASKLLSAIQSARMTVMGGLGVLVALVACACSAIGWQSSALKRALLAEGELTQARDALLQSEKRFRALVENANEAISIWDAAGNIILTTRASERISGYSFDELKGRNVGFVIHEEDRPKIQAVLQEVMQEPGKKVATRARTLHKDGQWRLLEGVFTNLCHDPAVGGIVVNYRDITARNAAETALKESEARLHAFLENSPLCLFIKDTSGRYIEVNPCFEQTFGLNAESVLGKNNAEVLHDRFWEPAEMRDEVVVHSGKTLDFEQTIENAEGIRTFSVQKFPICDANGTIFAIGGIICDITERKKAQEELRRSEARYRSLFENARDAILTLSPEGVITSRNSAAAQITGIPDSERIARPFDPFIAPEDLDLTKEMFRRAAAGEVCELFEIRVKGKSGLIHAEFSLTPQVEDGKIVGILAVARDVSQRRMLEEQLRQVQKMDCVGQLAGGVAHDFNNLLTIVQGNASLITLEESATPEIVGMAKDISEAAERGGSLTRQLLTFSRRHIVKADDIALDEVVGELMKMLRRLIGEDVALHFSCIDDLPLINGDAGMMEQVLVNLSVNARDAMPSGGNLTISIDQCVLPTDSQCHTPGLLSGHFVRMSVTDTGVGIAPEHMSHIFEPFFTTKEVGKGTGLGLATVYGIVKQHHGWVNVRSEIGAGTTFEVFLPVSKTRHKVLVEGKRSPTELVHGKGTILLVEDEAGLRGVVRTVLQRMGYNVLEARSGVEALKIWELHRSEIDLLFTDVVMPDGMSGPQLVREIQRQNPNLKVLFTSGYSPKSMVAGIRLEAGVNFLQKPYQPPQLGEVLRRMLAG